jgi:predicted ATPase/class 3 adenylate cyclase/Tfp pilus assembly protein PilF
VSDVRAILLTDVVDSTALNQQVGDAAMAMIWAQHDESTRALIRQWRGVEVGRSDGFLILFTTASDAVGFAIAHHQSLSLLSVPIKARVGIHVGPITLRENSSADRALGATPFEVDGIALPVAARVSALAGGGQTLVTESVLRDIATSSAVVQDFGFWRLKGVKDPLQIFGIRETTAAPLAPPDEAPKGYRVTRVDNSWCPTRELPNNLTRERDAFVGRAGLIDALADRVEAGARLITLLGIGGIGKTRTALHFAHAHLGEFAGGAWFCDLSQANTVDGILNAVAQALGVPLGKTDPVEHLGAAIAGRGRCLIVLDNFEQVTRYAMDTLDKWMATTDKAVYLVTSREMLGIQGEHVVPLPPLDQAEAIDLFKLRAHAAGSPDASNQFSGDLCSLVERLDCLPLAVELAAARASLLSPAQMLARMDERFKLLSSVNGRRDRQATLRATLDWSWDLLNDTERQGLARLSVFEGGFTLAAAESVIAIQGVAPGTWPVDVLHSLLRKSLVRQGPGQRFTLLRSVQDYALEHLSTPHVDSGGRPSALRRHWTYFASLSESEATDSRCVETDNLIAACLRAAAVDPESAVEVLARAWSALRLVGPFRAVLPLVSAVESHLSQAEGCRHRVDCVAGHALMLMGDLDQARRRFTSCLDAASELGDVAVQVLAQCHLADIDMADVNYRAARDRLDVALQMARQAKDDRTLMQVLNQCGSLHSELSQLDRAKADYTEALVVAERLGDRRYQGGLHGNLGTISHSQGQLADARYHYEAGLLIAHDVGDRQWEGNTRCNLGLLLHECGDHAAAGDELEAALAIARSIGHPRLEATALCNLGIVRETLGDLSGATERFASAVDRARALANRRMEAQFRGYLGLCRARQGNTAIATDDLEWAIAQLSDAEDPVSLGVALCQSAIAASLRQDMATSEVTAKRAEALLRPLNLSPDTEAMRLLEAAKSSISSCW